MKRIISLSMFLLFFLPVSFSQQFYPPIPNYSCLMPDGVVKFNILPKMISIEFKEEVTLLQIRKIFWGEDLVDIDSNNLNATSPLILSLRPGATTQQAWQLICRLRRNSLIWDANPFLIGRTEKEVVGFNKELLVKVKSGAFEQSLETILSGRNCKFTKEGLLGKGLYKIVVNGAADEVFSFSSELRRLDYIDFAEPNFIIFIQQNSNDTYYSKQWYLKNDGTVFPGNVTQTIREDIHIEEAWNSLGGIGTVESQNSQIKVAVLDIWGDSASTTHPDISNIQQAYDATATGFLSSNYAGESHGINCAGVIGANANNNMGIAGVAPNVKIYPIKIGRFNPNGEWDYVNVSNVSSIVIGINLSAFTIGVDIISNSTSLDQPTNAIINAIDNCVQGGRNGKGCTFVSSSGNHNGNVGFPANKSNVLSVGATTMCGTRMVNSNICGLTSTYTGGSNYGAELKVSAPGAYIATTDIVGVKGATDSDYHLNFSGTSAACPIVAGVAALIIGTDPSISDIGVKRIIESTCDKIATSPYSITPGYPNGTWNQYLGYGRVNAYRAVQKAAFNITLHAPISITPTTINQCSTITVSASIDNSGPKNWSGKVYFSLHKMNDDFIQDLLVTPNIIIPAGGNSVLPVTVSVNTIPGVNPGDLYKIYIKYQSNGTPYPNEYPRVEAGNFANPIVVPVNNSGNCDNLPIPPGSYKEVYLAGLNLNPQTNDLEFIVQGVPAQSGDVPVDLNVETEKIKKRFKQALVIPQGNQWASLTIHPDGNGWFIGDAVVGNNFETTDLAQDYLTGDYDFKRGTILNPIVSPSSIGNYWTSLVNQGPYLSQLQSQSNLYYPSWLVSAGIYTEGLNYNSKGPTKILINGAIWKMTKNIEWIDLVGVNNLSSNLRNTLTSKLPSYQTELNSRLQLGINQTLPLVNGTDPRYSTLRKDYRISTAAYWYRTLVNYTSKPFHNKINSNNLAGITAATPYDDQFWNSRAWQQLMCGSFNTYASQQGTQCIYGQSGSYNTYLVDSGAFSSTQEIVDSICFKNKGYVFQGPYVYFYGGILDVMVPDLLPNISISGNAQPILGDTVQIKVTVYNTGNANAQNFPVRLYEQYINNQNNLQSVFIGQQTISSLDSFSSQILQFNWVPLTYGSKKLLVTVDEGNFVIEHKETNNSATDSLFVRNNALLPVIFSPANGSLGANKNITLAGSVFDSREGYLTNNLSWYSSINGFLGSGGILYLDSLSAGSHIITLTGTNSHGQSASAYINIVLVSTYPQATITLPSSGGTFPDNSPIIFSGQATDYYEGNICNSTEWSSNLIGSLGAGCNISSQLPVGNHIIKFYAQNSSGDSASSTIPITIVDGKPTVNISSPPSNASYFQNQVVTLSGNASDFPQGNISNNIHWSSNIQGSLGIGQTITVNLEPGTHVITASVQDNAGSVAVDTILAINIRYNLPVPQIVQPLSNQTFFLHDTVKLVGHGTDIQDGSLHGGNLRWYSSIQGFLGEGDTVRTTVLTNGNHTVSLKATDYDGNDSTVYLSNIYINRGLPVPQIIQPVSGQTFFLHDTIKLVGHGTDVQDGSLHGSSLKWYSSIQGFLGYGDTVRTNILVQGYHSISLKVTDSDGNDSTVFISNLYINIGLPVAQILQPTNNQTFYFHDVIKLVGRGTDIQDGTLHGNNLEWYSDVQGVLGHGDSVSTNALNYGYHTIFLKVTDSEGNDSIVSVLNIYVDAGLPVVTISQPTNGASFFFGNSITFSGTAIDHQDGSITGSNLQWYSDGDGFLGTGNSIATNSLSAGNKAITLTSTDQDGFVVSSTVNFYIEPPHPPVVSLYYPFSNNHFTHGSSITLKASAIDYEEGVLNDNRVTWISSISGNIGVGKIISPTNLVVGVHNITVTAIDTTGLTTTATIQIVIDQQKPLAQITSPASGSIFGQGTNITFIGNGIDYEDGILTGNSLQWGSDVNGNIGNGSSIVASSLAVGSHLITLVSSDSQGAKDTASIIVIIQGPHNVIQTKFSGNKDSVVATYGISGGDSTTSFTLPQKAIVQSAQFTIVGDSVPYNTVEYIFAKRMGTASVGQVLQSKFGPIYSVGYGGFGTFGNITQTGSGAAFFVAKQRSDGVTQWVKSFVLGSNPIYYRESLGHIVEDAQGNIYALGSYRYSVNFGVDSFMNCAAYDAFLMKLDSNGNYLWSKHIYTGTGGGASEDFAGNLAISNSGRIYITGHFNNDGLAYIGSYSFPLSGGFNAFIASLDLNGNVLWGHSLGGNTIGSGVKVDNAGNIFVCGHSRSTTIDNVSVTNIGSADAFLAKYNSAGTIQWVADGGGSNSDEAYDLLVDSFNNVYITGVTCSGTFNWGATSVSTPGSCAFFIVKVNSNGSLLNIKVPGGSGNDGATSICSSPANKYYVGGWWGSSTFQSDTLLFSNGITNNSIVLQQNANSISESGFKIIKGSTGSSSLNSIQTDPLNNVLLGGDLNGTLGNFTIGGSGGFVSKRNHNPTQYPFGAFADVLSDLNKEWQYPSYFNSVANSSNFSSSLNSYLTGYVGSIATIPIRLHSDSAGKIKIKYLNVQYQLTDTNPPVFVNANLVPNSLPKNSTFSVRVRVSDNEKVDSVKAVFKNSTYNLTQVSPDSFQISILADTVGYFPVIVTVSDTNGLAHDTTLYVTVYSTTRDLEVLSSNMAISPSLIFTNDSVHLTAVVKNNSNLTISNAQVALIIDGYTMQTQTVTVNPLSQVLVNFAWVARWGQDTIVVKADPINLIVEASENNNIGTQYIFVNDIYAPAILQATATPNPSYVGNPVFFQVKAIDSTGISSVLVNWQGQNVTLTYNPGTTYYEGYVSANFPGISNAVITAFDLNNLSSSTSISIQVLQNLPDLKVYNNDFSFSPPISGFGNNASVQVKVRNSGSLNASNANVILRVDGVNIGTQVITILHDSSLVLSFPLQVNCGNHVFTVVLDSANAITESNEANNTTSVTQQFCTLAPSYALNANAIPNILSVNSQTDIQLASVPATTSAVVTVLWNSQNIPMPFNSSTGHYSTPIYPTQVGNYVLPVLFSYGGGLQSTINVHFTVLDSLHFMVIDSIPVNGIDSLPDLSISNLSCNYPVLTNVTSQFVVTVSNNSAIPVPTTKLYLLTDNQLVDSMQIPALNAFDTAAIQLNWNSTIGIHQLKATIDPNNQITESDEANNSRTMLVHVQDNEPPVIHFVNASSPLNQGGFLQITSYVTDNVSVATVVANFMGNSYPLQYDSLSGNWKVVLTTPLNGIFNISITATDNASLSAFASTIISVNDTLPDLRIQGGNFTFLHVDSVTNIVTVLVQNNGYGTANNTKIHFTVDGTLLDSIETNLSGSQIDTLNFNFNYPVGLHTVSVSIDPFNVIHESDETNNSASQIVFIPDLDIPASPVVVVMPSSWSASQNFSASWNQIFDNSGVVTYEYSVDGNIWTNVGTNLSTNVAAPVEGLSYVFVRAKDAVGNLSQPGIGEMKYDNTPPNAPMIAEYHCGTSWSTHESPYIEWLNPGDIGSGVEYFEVSVDNTSPVNIGFNFNEHPVLSSGIHTLKVRAIDYVGHIGNWSNVVTVFIDLDNPDCPNVISATHPNQNVWYRSDSVVFNWARPIETSAITGYFYRITHDSIYPVDQSGYWTGKDSLTLAYLPTFDSSQVRLPDGVWFIHVVSQDTVGHISSSDCSYKFMIDKTPPFSTANYQDTVTNCNYSFTIQSEDYYSGIAYTYYRINGGNWLTDSVVLVNNVGMNFIEFYSVDLAGNSERFDTAMVFVNNQSVSLNLGSDTVICSGQTLIVDAGNIGAAYNWNTGSNAQTLSVTQTGIYWVTVTRNGCQASDSINVQVSAPNTSITADTTVICASDSVYICATSGQASYHWNSGQLIPCIYIKQAGNYYVTITDVYGCSAESNHISNAVHPLPPVSISVNGDTLVAYNATTYQWYLNDTIIPGATSELLIAHVPGLYSVVVSDANGCVAISNNLLITLGINDIKDSEKIDVYPNPQETGGWNLVVGEGLVGSKLELLDNNSRLIYKSEIHKLHSVIDLEIPSGMYLLRIYTSKNLFMQKLVKL